MERQIMPNEKLCMAKRNGGSNCFRQVPVFGRDFACRLGRRQNGSTLWHLAADKNRSRVATAALAHQEDHVIAALELRGHLAEVVFRVHRLLVYLQEYIASGEADVIGVLTHQHICHAHSYVRYSV